MIYPMFMVVLLTFIVGLIAMKVRITSLKSGSVKIGYFKLMEGEDVPELVTKTTRCFNNMFELPVLFYAACLLYVSLGVESPVGIFLAWLFVLLRYLHTWIHLTYNHLIHRMLAFWFSFLSALGLWLNLLYLQLQRG